MHRPDLSTVDPEIVQYIEFLEKKLGLHSVKKDQVDVPAPSTTEIIYTEPETTNCILTMSQNGYIKRSYRPLYSRQHRGGMGVFDLDTNQSDSAVLLAAADENQTLLLFTDHARVFRYPVRHLVSQPVRAHGEQAYERLGLETGERIIAMLPEQARGYVALASQIGKVRSLRHHLFGEHMRQGTVLFNTKEFGPLAAACWSPGDADLFILTRSGMGIRFNEKALPPQGGLGIRVADGDEVVSVTPVDEQSSVFLIGSDGKGTIRLMSGFAANKTPGGNGKIAMKSSSLVGASSISPDDEVFAVTRLSKIIRFKVDEVPSTEGVVQGVNCLAMRMDEVVSFVVMGDKLFF